MAGMWCIAFIASIIVVVLVLLILWLILWNVTEQIEARVSSIISNFVELGQSFIIFFGALADFIRSATLVNRETLRQTISEISETLSRIVGLSASKISNLLNQKVEVINSILSRGSTVSETDFLDLEKINQEISEIFTKASTRAKTRVATSLNELDRFLLENRNTRGQIQRQTLISKTVRSIMDASNVRIRNVVSPS